MAKNVVDLAPDAAVVIGSGDWEWHSAERTSLGGIHSTARFSPQRTLFFSLQRQRPSDPTQLVATRRRCNLRTLHAHAFPLLHSFVSYAPPPVSVVSIAASVAGAQLGFPGYRTRMSLHASSSRVLGFHQLSSRNGPDNLLQSHGTDVVGSPALAECSVVCGSRQPSQGLPDTRFVPRVAHGCAFGNFGQGLDLEELVQAREQFGGMGNDGHEERPSQPAVTPVADLDDLLWKLSAWDGSSAATYDEPTSSAATQEVYHVDVNGEKTSFSGVSEENHLEMEEIEPEDIDVILRMSSADFSSFAGVKDGENGKFLDDEAAERKKVEAEVSSTSDLSSTGEAPIGDEVVESSHIWYACYGSNMWKKRFMCYIEGGMVEGMAKPCIGCRDKSPPVASDWISIPHRLFFGHERTRMWGLGGVAFLNPVSEPGVLSHIRIYKITMGQFNDVLSQENPGRPERHWMNGKDINELKKREPHYLMDIFGEASWYGTVKYLGEKDGLPILTFTCPESHVEKFRSGEFRTCGPPDSYRNTFVHGLVEDFGFTEEQAHEYVSSAVLPKKDIIDHKEGSQESLQNRCY